MVSGRGPSVLPKGKARKGKKFGLRECQQGALRVRVRRKDTAVTLHRSARHLNGKIKSKAFPEQASYGLRIFKEVEAPTCRDNQHTKVEILSAVYTGHL